MSPARVLSEISGWRDRGRYPLARVGSRWRCASGGRRRGDQRKPLNDLQACTTMTPLERRVKIALGAGLTAPAIARLLRISIGKARRIAAKMAIERMNTELARSRVQLGDPA